METDTAPARSLRPYFVPEGIDFDSLPEPVKLALQTVVQPAYDELVLAAPNALERSMGASVVFLLTEEVLEQFELGRQMNFTQSRCAADREDREKSLARYLQLVGAKNSAANALLRLRRLPSFPRFTPMGPPSFGGES